MASNRRAVRNQRDSVNREENAEIQWRCRGNSDDGVATMCEKIRKTKKMSQVVKGLSGMFMIGVCYEIENTLASSQ